MPCGHGMSQYELQEGNLGLAASARDLGDLGSFVRGNLSEAHKAQDDARGQRAATHDRVEDDRVRPRDVDLEEPDVRHPLRGEEREG
jgi:hypothetical protein